MELLLLMQFSFILHLSILAAAEAAGAATGLEANFYRDSCPRAENLTRASLTRMAVLDPTLPPALLRLAFHDCQVQGCDGSILLETDAAANITSERAAASNFGIRRLDAIDRVKSMLESACPGVVSCADIVAIAARDAVALSGGPSIPILTGRRDGVNASTFLAQESLLPASSTADRVLSTMQSQGFDIVDAVALLGAHTLGVSHCPSVVNRLYPKMDSSLPTGFGASLRLRCPSARFVNNITFIANDFTNLAFDNRFFKDILARTGVLTVDQEIANDSRTKNQVKLFASDREAFFQAFSKAFLKLTQLNLLTGASGQVRRDCRRVN